MRTTLNIEDDVLLLAKQVAARERISLGEALSELARKGAQSAHLPPELSDPPRGRFALLGKRDEVITPDHIRELMDREGM